MAPLMVRSQNADRLTDKVMEPEQFTQVIEAILSGKYSWACVLILRFAGYNPLHYIPYRTYNRLVKENAHCRKRDRCQAENTLQPHEIGQQKSKASAQNQIKDLAFLETANEHQTEVHGGYLQHGTNSAWRSYFLRAILTRR